MGAKPPPKKGGLGAKPCSLSILEVEMGLGLVS